MAKRLHDESSQGQVEGELETRDLTDLFGGGVLGRANGDTLVCEQGPELQASIEGMSPTEAVAHLSDPRRPGALNPGAASALATAWTQAQQLAAPSYVTEAVHEWSRDSRYRLRVAFGSFILGV